MFGRNVTAQEIYDHLYAEVVRRYKAHGLRLPQGKDLEKLENEIFLSIYRDAEKAIIDKTCPPDFLEELMEVNPRLSASYIHSLIEDHDDREAFDTFKKLIL